MRDSRSTSSAGAIRAELIIELIGEHQPVSAEDLLRLLADQLPAGLAEAQKLACIHNQLRHLVDVGKISNKGSRRYPKWGFA
jgi:hypothetical protein